MMPALLLDPSLRARHLRWLSADIPDACVATPIACAIATQNPKISSPTARAARSRPNLRSSNEAKQVLPTLRVHSRAPEPAAKSP
jgi:hypothetical protein